MLLPPITWTISQTFLSSSGDSIYGRLMKNNLEGLKSFLPPKEALEKLTKSSEPMALFSLIPIHNFEEFQCKVC